MFIALSLYKRILAKREHFTASGKQEQQPKISTLRIMFTFLHAALFIIALRFAYRCGNKPDKNMFLHVALAFFFPEIYLIYYFITKCKSKTI